MASPSSLREPVKMRSTATTTLWELVSPICSCRLASLLESRPPLAITDNKQHQKRWVKEILHTRYQWGSTQFWLKFSSFYTIQSTINLIQSMFNSKREKYWITNFHFINSFLHNIDLTYLHWPLKYTMYIYSDRCCPKIITFRIKSLQRMPCILHISFPMVTFVWPRFDPCPN